MTTIYNGNRSFYLDDQTGKLWDSEKRRTQYDPITYTETDKVTATVVETVPDTVPVSVEPDSEKHICPVCAFEAKSFAGLQVHKFKKH